ncbi:hypothetical protein RR46_01846 [Papilio xuthus]|uniref:Uncharacterized protein n=1 Tax=Papilio xuthus TaxID=66420 RepID=A0A194QEP5_PAPXU|nr:hypothetical protein RR46_01846 [Papilio xuthus]
MSKRNNVSDSPRPRKYKRIIYSSEEDSDKSGTLLERTTFSLAVSLRIGARTNEPHRCRCGVNVDPLGHHGLACRRSAQSHFG